MEKVTKWHCAVLRASQITNDIAKKEARVGYLTQTRVCTMTGIKYLAANDKVIVLWKELTTAEGHWGLYTHTSNWAYTYGTKKQALRGIMPQALELLAGDMAATVKLMKFMEDNGLDLEEEALE